MKMWEKVKMALWLGIPLAMTSCHAFLSAPWLLTHHSSAAFEAMVTLWILILFAWWFFWPTRARKE